MKNQLKFVRLTKQLCVHCMEFFLTCLVFTFQIPDSKFSVYLSAPKIMFTKLESDQFEKNINQLGGSVEHSPDKATVLVSKHVHRTCKFLCAMNRGIPIVTPQWINDSVKAKEFLAVDQYIIRDTEAENKFQFDMMDSLGECEIRYFLKISPDLLSNFLDPSFNYCRNGADSEAIQRLYRFHHSIGATSAKRNLHCG